MTSEGSAVLEPLWNEMLASDELVGAGIVTCGINPQRTAVRQARQFTQVTLQRWGLACLFDDVALVASELVTNALRHAVRMDGVDHQTAGSAERGTPIRYSLACDSTQVVCAVRDPSREPPVTRLPHHVSETGRGLHLVSCFSDHWTWRPLDGTGKVVWAVFKLSRLPSRGGLSPTA